MHERRRQREPRLPRRGRRGRRVVGISTVLQQTIQQRLSPNHRSPGQHGHVAQRRFCRRRCSHVVALLPAVLAEVLLLLLLLLVLARFP